MKLKTICEGPSEEIPDGYYVFFGDTATVIDGKRVPFVFDLKRMGFSPEDFKEFMTNYKVVLSFKDRPLWEKIKSLPQHHRGFLGSGNASI
jgi:hypothetical protein